VSYRVRFRHSGADEFVAPAAITFDDGEGWWASFSRVAVGVALAASLHSQAAVQAQVQTGQAEDVPTLSAAAVVTPDSRLLRAEIWTELGCNSGVQKAVLPLVYCTTTVKLEGLVVVPRLTAAIPMAWAQRSEVINGRVVRLTFVDTTFDEYRIQVQDDVSAGDGLVRIDGVGPIMDLAHRSKFISTTTAGVVTFVVARTATSPTTLLTTDALGGAPTYFGVGTVTPTTVLTLTFAGDTPLAGAIRVATAANLATGTVYWISASRDGTTGYDLNLSQLNYSAVTPLVLTAKNLVSLRRRQSSLDQANRIVVVDSNGENALGNNQWPVAVVSAGAYIDVDGVGSGISPLLAADALNNYYVIDDGAVAHLITDSAVISATRARLSMASTTGIAVAENVRIAVDSAGTQLQYLEDTVSQATYGIKLGELTANSATPAVNCQDALAVLRTNANPLVNYDIDLIDLYRLDSTIYAADKLLMGGQVIVVDSELGIANGDLTARIVELSEDHIQPVNSKVVLASRRNQLTTILAAA